MFNAYFKKFLLTSLSYALYSLIFGFPFLIYGISSYPIITAIAYLIFFAFVGYGAAEDFFKEKDIQIKLAEESAQRAEKEKQKAEDTKNKWKQSLLERTAGFPTLHQSIDYYEELLDDQVSRYLRTKSHPALTSAEIVKQETKKRRIAEYNERTTQSIIEYYETIAPFLLDFKEQLIDENEDALRDYTDEEKEDPVINFLTKEEYRKLNSTERNQMALDRFWKRSKPKWLIGKLYERYIGYLYETEGYKVDYIGVFKGYEDLGRDLICKKGKEVIIIQCKNWSQFKTIFEKHIFQFFGTVFQYKDEFKTNVEAKFYTSTEVSPLAKRFAKELGIELIENYKLDTNYPCIKCNISKMEGGKVYHLPFDQQYDNTIIELSKGEFYCSTVAEAEAKGFRRAFKWKGK